MEEGLAATANGSSKAIDELSQKVRKLDGGANAPASAGAWGQTPVQAPGVNNVVTNFPPPAKDAKKPKPPPGFKPPVPPAADAKPATPLPDFPPAFSVKSDAPAPARLT